MSYVLVPSEIVFSAVRAQGPGGQNVNTVANAVHLRFDIAASSLPEELKAKLRMLGDHRISKDGVVVVKAQRFRSLEKNRTEAMRRLAALIASAARVEKVRRPTRPSMNAVKRRLDGKTRRAEVKAGRKVPEH